MRPAKCAEQISICPIEIELEKECHGRVKKDSTAMPTRRGPRRYVSSTPARVGRYGGSSEGQTPKYGMCGEYVSGIACDLSLYALRPKVQRSMERQPGNHQRAKHLGRLGTSTVVQRGASRAGHLRGILFIGGHMRNLHMWNKMWNGCPAGRRCRPKNFLMGPAKSPLTDDSICRIIADYGGG